MRRVLLTGLLVAEMAGCAGRQAPEGAGSPASPRVGWVIMQGSDVNPDEDFVCQSAPRTPCEMRASAPARKSFSAVHLYFHPAQADATYEGTTTIGFFEGARPVQSSVAVKRGASPGNHSVVGIVTDKPGTYTLDIAMAATTAAGPTQIREQVPIVVK